MHDTPPVTRQVLERVEPVKDIEHDVRHSLRLRETQVHRYPTLAFSSSRVPRQQTTHPHIPQNSNVSGESARRMKGDVSPEMWISSPS